MREGIEVNPTPFSKRPGVEALDVMESGLRRSLPPSLRDCVMYMQDLPCGFFHGQVYEGGVLQWTVNLRSSRYTHLRRRGRVELGSDWLWQDLGLTDEWDRNDKGSCGARDRISLLATPEKIIQAQAERQRKRFTARPDINWNYRA